VKGFKSKHKCQPPTVLDLPFDSECCSTIEKKLFKCVKQGKVEFDCKKYRDAKEDVPNRV